MSAPRFLNVRSASVSALVSRLLVLTFGLANSVILPLVISQYDVGMFFMAQLAISALGTFGQGGLTLTIPTNVTRPFTLGHLAIARQHASQTVAASLILSASVGTLFYAGAGLSAFKGPDHAVVLYGIVALATVLITYNTILIELLRAVHRYKTANYLTALSSASAVVFTGACLLLRYHPSLIEILLAGLAGPAMSAVVATIALARHLRHWPVAEERVQSARILRQALPSLWTTVILFLLAQFDFALLALVAPADQVALYGIATRLSSILLIPLGIANSSIAPISTALLAAEKKGELQQLFYKVSLACAGLALLGYLFFLFSGPAIIRAWNPAYAPSYHLFLILGLGQIIHAACGSAGAFLMISGDDRYTLRLVFLSGIASAAACILGFALWGLNGLAAGSAVGNVIQVVCFTLRVRARFGLDPSIAAASRLLKTPGNRS